MTKEINVLMILLEDYCKQDVEDNVEGLTEIASIVLRHKKMRAFLTQLLQEITAWLDVITMLVEELVEELRDKL